MARTNIQRLQEAKVYIHQNVSSELALAIDAAARQSPLSDDQLGAALSLSGYSFWRYGSADQHLALRSLLLCQKLFLNSPYAKDRADAGTSYNLNPDLPKTEYRSSSEGDIVRAARCYVTVGAASHDDLAGAAATASPPGGKLVYETLTRSIDPFPAMQICFDAVRMWLFKAGFVSIRWLASIGPRLQAETANDILGRGIGINRDALARMRRGRLFNFHKAGHENVCHWGISLGGGIGAAANTSSDWPGVQSPVHFRSGGTKYGIFPMVESYDVCLYKYTDTLRTEADVTIRQIDPRAVQNYF